MSRWFSVGFSFVFSDVEGLPPKQWVDSDPRSHCLVCGQQFWFDLALIEKPVQKCGFVGC
jgi:hypothetical protein